MDRNRFISKWPSVDLPASYFELVSETRGRGLATGAGALGWPFGRLLRVSVSIDLVYTRRESLRVDRRVASQGIVLSRGLDKRSQSPETRRTMKMEQLKKRLDKNRPMTTISIRSPEDVIDELKRIAPLRGFSGYQPLVRAYVGQGLRVDLERFDREPVEALIESLKRHGVSEEIINEALGDLAHR